MARNREIEPLQPDHPAELTNLARNLSRSTANLVPSWDRQSSRQTAVDETLLEDSVVDPSHPSFDAYKWARLMIEIGQKKGVRERKMSVLFNNLNVYGTGDVLCFQKTVGSFLRMPVNVWRWIFGTRVKKTILRQFEGVLVNGEMLLVLGRPSSGCSTFLKTISGDVHGLFVDQNSHLQYNGITAPST